MDGTLTQSNNGVVKRPSRGFPRTTKGRVHLTLACGDYDRTAPLRNGDVRVDGVELNYLPLPVEETFFRMVSFEEFDAAELSLSTYVLTLDRDPALFVAIPVFPSRMFRHSAVYVRADAGIERAGDLAGKRVGVPEYQVTAAVWVRGILEEHYGLPVNSVRYRTGGLHEPGRYEKTSIRLGSDVDIAPIGPDQTLSQMLLDGELDALYTPRTPQPYAEGDRRIARLFHSSAVEEQDYFRRTGIFPIMHVVVLRREVYEAHPWLARSLQKAFEDSKRLTMEGIDETAALGVMLPWFHDEVARTRDLMGSDWWSYGLEANQTTLDTFLQYSYDQNLASRRWQPEEIFAPESLASVLV